MKDSKFRQWAIPILCLLILVIFLFIWNELEHSGLRGFWVDFFGRLSEAIIIAMVLAVTTDLFLKKEFGREVFFASVGYVLPDELRPEMRWLCQLNELCTQDTMICTLTPIGDSIKFHVHRTQVVKNIGQNKHELKVGLGIDQWFRDEADSRILKFSFMTDGQKWAHGGDARRLACGLNLPDDVPLVSLEKDKEVTIISEFEEIYPRNGYFFMHIKYATSGARITVNCQDEKLDLNVELPTRVGREVLRVRHDYVCPFTLLPYQKMAVRFWDKERSGKWTAATAA